MFEPLDHQKCCGCMACADVCSQKVIRCQRDALGFVYPVVKQPDACVQCGLCMQVCPGRGEKPVERNVGEVYCAFNKNEERRLRGASGGIFEELARPVLSRGGVIAGAAFADDFSVRHVLAESPDELSKLQGSKYTQSDTLGIYQKTERLLKSGREVLFSGTPCQVAALKEYLRKPYEKLYTVDLFCYGVPAPAVWQAWLAHISKGRKPVSVSFRDKTDGAEKYSLKVVFEDGSVYCQNKTKDLFLKTFPRGSYIRESCLNCRWKAFPRASDLSLGDFQELGELLPQMDGHMGVSMIKVNTAKGAAMLEACGENVAKTLVSAQRMDACHPGMGNPAMRHPNRDRIQASFGSMPVNRLLARYAGMPLKQRLRFAAVKAAKKVKLYDILRKKYFWK